MILPKAHFVDIVLHIFNAVVMMRSDILTLYQAPEIFNIVRMNSVSRAVLSNLMIYCKVNKFLCIIENIISAEIVACYGCSVFTDFVQNCQ